MIASSMYKSFLLGAALLLATSAFAANRGSLQLNDSTNVGTTKLSAGDYTISWDSNGQSNNNVEVTILRGRKVVATMPGKLIDLNRGADNNSAVVKNNGDGTRSLAEVRFSGKRYALALGDQSVTADSGSK